MKKKNSMLKISPSPEEYRQRGQVKSGIKSGTGEACPSKRRAIKNNFIHLQNS
jgi:hypothetical protein